MQLNASLLSEIKSIITDSREQAIRAVDSTRVLMYWHVGKRIFEEEQQSKDRADYGKQLIRSLAEQLEPEFGSGFSKRQLDLMRQFLPYLSNCERTAFTIELDALSPAHPGWKMRTSENII